MREILFKAKRIDNGEWIEGYYVHADETLCKSDVHVIFDGYDLSVAAENEVDPETVCQYTGLIDKNGAKIFEGDIIKFAEWSNGEMCWIGQIIYDNCLFAIIGGANEECEGDFHIQLSAIPSERIEVLGSIHDKED